MLNLTDEQILQEYTHNSPRSKKSLSTIIGGIVGVLICVAVLGGATAALVFGYKWYINTVAYTVLWYTHYTMYHYGIHYVYMYI